MEIVIIIIMNAAVPHSSQMIFKLHISILTGYISRFGNEPDTHFISCLNHFARKNSQVENRLQFYAFHCVGDTSV
jgi:hypothetical protein